MYLELILSYYALIWNAHPSGHLRENHWHSQKGRKSQLKHQLCCKNDWYIYGHDRPWKLLGNLTNLVAANIHPVNIRFAINFALHTHLFCSDYGAFFPLRVYGNLHWITDLIVIDRQLNLNNYIDNDVIYDQKFSFKYCALIERIFCSRIRQV